MERRRFLRHGLMGAAALALGPAWLRRAFADTSLGDRGDVVGEAMQRAQRAGHDVLVLVIPAGDGDKWVRGTAFGELLQHGSDAQLAPLARVEVVAATMTAVRAHVTVAGEPLMVAIDVGAGRGTPLDASLPASSTRRGAADAKDDAIIDARIAALAGLVQATFGARPAALGKEVRARLSQRVPGSHWGTQSGCGTRIDDDEEPTFVKCGMGHVPARSARFLYLYAETPTQQRRRTRSQ